MLFDVEKVHAIFENLSSFEVVEYNKPKRDLVIQWAGRKFIIAISNKDHDDEEYLYNTQFSVTIAFGGLNIFTNEIPLVDKYKIINITNLESNNVAVVGLRNSSLNLFQITANHVLLFRNDDLLFFENESFRSEYMKNSIIGMMFMCVTKLKELQDNIKKYNENEAALMKKLGVINEKK